SSSIWMLVDPPEGNFNVVATSTVAASTVVGAMTFTGVDQSTPLGSPVWTGNSAFYAGGDVVTLNVPSSPGDLIFDLFTRAATDAYAAGAGQTIHWNQTVSTNHRGNGSTKS